MSYIIAAQSLKCEVAAIQAVAQVESSGSGMDPEGFPVTLFEGHKFSAATKGVYDLEYPTLSYPKWTKQFYGKDWKAEKLRLTQAECLDRDAAMSSASWGKFQIMGFNWKQTGATSLQDFINVMCSGEEGQLALFCGFIARNISLLTALRSRNWKQFAQNYNGKDYALNSYDTKLAAAYKKFSTNPQ